MRHTVERIVVQELSSIIDSIEHAVQKSGTLSGAVKIAEIHVSEGTDGELSHIHFNVGIELDESILSPFQVASVKEKIDGC
ncbi:MAG TPA: hypothetical protein VK255_00775, partial [Patescibacteria group bacterium]|nr:hypothetical protein [Patescibacteria group bacterium]